MNHLTPQYDVLTLGETMARFTPPDYQRFGQSRSVEMHVGGSESNTAVGLARLGHRVCWLSRMTDNPVGRWISSEIAAQGVDVGQIVWTNEDRVGTYYMERGRAPRGSHVFYDRAGSAMSHMQPHELNSKLFHPDVARIFHTTGITVGLSNRAQKTVQRAVELARSAKQLISFDLNYRSRLWSASEAYTACEPIMAQADLVFLPIRDAYAVCRVDAHKSPHDVCRELQLRWRSATVVLTRGNLGAVALDAHGSFCEQAAFSADEVERLGGGDAFSAGYLSAVLSGLDLQQTMRWGCAAAALKYTIPGDLPLLDREQLERLVNSPHHAAQSIQR